MKHPSFQRLRIALAAPVLWALGPIAAAGTAWELHNIIERMTPIYHGTCHLDGQGLMHERGKGDYSVKRCTLLLNPAEKGPVYYALIFLYEDTPIRLIRVEERDGGKQAVVWQRQVEL